MMPNLMPCPMPTCGAPIDAVHLVPQGMGAFTYVIRCDCGLTFDTGAQSEAAAADRWNERPALADDSKPVTDTATGEWISCSEKLPSTPLDSDTTFIVAVKRARNSQTYVFAAEWLNAKLLCTPDVDEPEDGLPYTGWHSLEPHSDYDEYWEPLISPGSGDEVTHWQPLPKPPTQ